MVTLTKEQTDSYREKGYMRLRSVFSEDEMAACKAECNRLLKLGIAHKNNLRTFPHYISETAWVVDRLDPVLDISPVFSDFVMDERILRPLREACGDDVILFKDRLIYKMPGSNGYPIHQDYSWWQRFPRDLLNVAVAIDTADAGNGAIELFPGYQHQLLSTPKEMRHMSEEESRQIDFSKGELMEAASGDMVIFHCLVPHRSGPNLSNRLRRQLYLTYSATKHGSLYDAQLELFKQGLSSRRIKSDEKDQMFFR